MIYVLISVSISMIVIVGLLLVTRQRLARQFEDIQRRLLELEHTATALKLHRERSTTAAQLQRLHAGLVRVQENVAARYGVLAPMARAAEKRGPSRWLGDFQCSALHQWSAALNSPMEPGQIEEIAHAIGHFENLERMHIPLETIDIAAQVIALKSVPRHGAKVALIGAAANALAPLLDRPLAGFFESLEVLHPADGGEHFAPADALVFDAVEARGGRDFPGLVKGGGILIIQRGGEEDDLDFMKEFSVFELIASEWKTAVYQKENS